MNPYCSHLCQLAVAGRPAVFCSVTCRSRYYRRREELIRALEQTDQAIAASSKKERPQLRRRRKALRFHLMRYPVITTSVTNEAAL